MTRQLIDARVDASKNDYKEGTYLPDRHRSRFSRVKYPSPPIGSGLPAKPSVRLQLKHCGGGNKIEADHRIVHPQVYTYENKDRARAGARLCPLFTHTVENCIAYLIYSNIQDGRRNTFHKIVACLSDILHGHTGA